MKVLLGMIILTLKVLKNKLITKFKVREYSLKLDSVDLNKYVSLLERLDSEGIKFYDAKKEMRKFPDHYVKLEELGWEYGQDFPMPEGIIHTREPFKQFMKYQKLFEE